MPSLCGKRKKPVPKDVDEVTTVSYLSLYGFASPTDKALLSVGVIFAIINGAAMPGFAYFYGNFLNSAGSGGVDLMDQVSTVSLQLLVVAAVAFVSGSVWNGVFTYCSNTMGTTIRIEYFRAVVGQDISWFDVRTPAALPSRMTEDVFKVEEAIGYRAGLSIVNMSQFVLGYALGFYRGWQITLVMMSSMPIIIVSTGILGRMIGQRAATVQAFYAAAGAVAEEVFNSIRTVAAFGAEAREVDRYSAKLTPARDGGIKSGRFAGIMVGVVWACIFLTYALTFWFGGGLIYDGVINPSTGEVYTGGDILTVFFASIMATFSLGQLAPNMQTFAEGKAAGAKIFPLFKQKADIEPTVHEATEIDRSFKLESITLKNVEFTYPARPDTQVLKGVSLAIKAGEKVAFVGESGSGKSTIVQLMERFYDPEAGVVMMNGKDVREIGVHQMRSVFGYVGQEPFMFATSIKNNLTYGLMGKQVPSTDDIEDACRKAQVLDFIRTLPDGFDTYCGAGGGQISGGQKQRIAIARALLRQPQVLLLDEATSALDNDSEKMVQKTIDHLQATYNITTISIAHRLSTIRNSDTIFVMKRGNLVESGTHTELMEGQGEYSALVSAQTAALAKDAVDFERTKTGSFHRLHTPMELAPQASAASGGATPGRARSAALSHVIDLGEDEDALEKTRKKTVAKAYKIPYARLFGFSREQAWMYVPAIIGSAGKGIAMPMNAFLLSHAMASFYNPNKEEMMESVESTSLQYVAMGCVVFVAAILNTASFSYIGEYFTYNVRRRCFAKLVEQDMAFFDEPEHAPGKLTTSLSTYAVKMNSLTGTALGTYSEALCGFIGGCVIAFFGSWKLTLVMMCMLPLMVFAQKIRVAANWALAGQDSDSMKQASLVASEALQNMRTVRAFISEAWTIEFYKGYVVRTLPGAKKSAAITGLTFGLSNAIMFLAYAAGFYYGGYLMTHEGLDFQAMIQSLMAIMMAAMGIGQAMAFLPDIDEAKVASHDVFELLDTESKVNAVKPDGTVTSMGDGTVEFKSVHFHYPSRPEVEILNGLSFRVEAGQQVALVGPSGGGKSTVLAMLQRFYDVTGGSVCVGGTDTRMLDVAWWRSQCGLVGQEPVLFDMSLAENLRYGKIGAEDDELLTVAKQAKMDFAQALGGPVAWDDSLGPKGGRLSGGQKQRTAIARALIRNPKVMFLDEATSALDSASERVVQEALDSAAVGRTTFTIAHRLSTIQHCDVILVVADGRLVERGTHDELMEIHGVYYDLYTKGQQ